MIEDRVNWEVGCPHVDRRFALFCHAESSGAVSCPLAYGRGPCVVDLGEWGAWRASLAYFMSVDAAFGDLSELLAYAAFDLPTEMGLNQTTALLHWAFALVEEMTSHARAVGWSW